MNYSTKQIKERTAKRLLNVLDDYHFMASVIDMLDAGMTQADVARKMGVTRQYIHQLLKGGDIR